MKLTKATIDTLRIAPGKQELFVWDETLPGFGLRLRSGGKRTWVVQYRIGQKQRRISLGSVDRLDPDEARKRAKTALAKAQLGTDAQEEKTAARKQESLTFSSIVKDYLARHAMLKLKPGTFSDTQRYLLVDWKDLSRLPINKITRQDIASGISKISNEKGGVAANRARAAIGSFFSWAIAEGLADSSPVTGTRKAIDEVPRDRVLSDAELKLIWLNAGEGDYGDIIRLLMLTGQRREEIAAMTWDEINLENELWSIHSTRTKNSRQHDVPLNNLAIKIIRERPRQEKRDMVFGQKGPFSGWSKAKTALDRRIIKSHGKSINPWRLHDIRRTVATRLADLGVQPHVVEALLNHISGHKSGVAGIYNRSSYSKDKVKALKLWSKHITNITDGDI